MRCSSQMPDIATSNARSKTVTPSEALGWAEESVCPGIDGVVRARSSSANEITRTVMTIQAAALRSPTAPTSQIRRKTASGCVPRTSAWPQSIATAIGDDELATRDESTYREVTARRDAGSAADSPR